jgi:hypothetical protein
MNAPDLRDIHLPDASLWWPPAAGWWLGMALVLALLLLLPRWLRWLRHQPLRRSSLRQLEHIRELHEEGRSDKEVLREIVALLRRVTISYYGRSGAAGSTGTEWWQQLCQLAPGADFSKEHFELLTRGRYQPQANIEVESLLRDCERWLRHLPRSRGHVAT